MTSKSIGASTILWQDFKNTCLFCALEHTKSIYIYIKSVCTTPIIRFHLQTKEYRKSFQDITTKDKLRRGRICFGTIYLSTFRPTRYCVRQ